MTSLGCHQEVTNHEGATPKEPSRKGQLEGANPKGHHVLWTCIYSRYYTPWRGCPHSDRAFPDRHVPWQKKTDAMRGFGALPAFAPYRQRLASVWGLLGLLGPSPPPRQGAEPASFRWICLPGAPPLLPAPDLVAASLGPAAADQIQRQEHTARQLPPPDAVLSPPSTECYGVQGSSLMVPPWASI